MIAEQPDYNNEIVQNSTHEKKKKRKRKQVNDLQFEEAKETLGIRSKRKEQRKGIRKKANTEENLEFGGWE